MSCAPRWGGRQLRAWVLTVASVLVYAGVTPPMRAASPDTAPALPAPSGAIVTVSNVDQLQAAFRALQANQTVVINPGTYYLTASLYVNGRANVTVRGATNNRNDVVISGRNNTGIPYGIWTGQGASNVMIANLTIRDIAEHPIILNPGTTSPRIYNVRLVNAGTQFIKANPDPAAGGAGVNNGVVEYSVLEYENTAPSDYTNGIDVHGGSGWIIRHNLFRRIRAPQGQLAGPAILMWRGASGTLVEGNTFIDCHRDIAIGFENGTSHSGGIVRNNFIYRSAGAGGDVGITIVGSTNTKVVNNTIFLNGQYPNAIETRYTTTGGQVVNNLGDRGLQQRDGSAVTQQGNVWTATANLFVNSTPGDLHLLATAAAVIDRGVSTNDAPADWDGQTRGGARDVGADEYFASAPPTQPPAPTEICGNGIDDDGDGQVDEGCPATPTPPAPPPPTEVCGDGVDNDGDGQVDEGCTRVTPPAVPGAPSRLVGRVRGSTVALTWLAPITGAAPARYVVEAGAAPGQTALTLPVTQTAITVPGVGRGRYYVRVKAQNAAGASVASNEVAVSIGCGGPSGAPRAFTAPTAGQLVSLNWEDPDGCSGSRYWLVAGSQPGAADLGLLPVDSSGTTMAAPPGTYYARMGTQSDFGISGLSNEVRVVATSGDCSPPSFGLVLGANVSGSLVGLSWAPTSTSAALASDAFTPLQYALEVGATPGAASLSYPMGRATAVVIPAPAGDYYVRVRAVNACGAGQASSDVLVRVR